MHFGLVFFRNGRVLSCSWAGNLQSNLATLPQISRGAVKEQTRLSRSSDIIPVLQVKTQTKRETYICCTVFTRLQCNMTKVKC